MAGVAFGCDVAWSLSGGRAGRHRQETIVAQDMARSRASSCFASDATRGRVGAVVVDGSTAID